MTTIRTHAGIVAVMTTVGLLTPGTIAEERRIDRHSRVVSPGTIRHAEHEPQIIRPAQREPSDRPPTRVVPRYGTTVTAIPRDASRVVVGGREYHHSNGTYYAAAVEGGRTRYIVSRPPPTATIDYLPEGYEVVTVAGKRYYYYDDVYFERVNVFGPPRYGVVDVPIGGWIYSLPPEYRVVILDGARTYIIGNRYYRAEYRGGRIVYVCYRLVGGPPVVRPPEPSSRHSVTGLVEYRQRIALPDRGVTVVVRLVEVKLLGQRKTIKERKIRDPGQIPIPFEIRYDESDIKALKRYEVEARIEINDRLAYRNFTAYPVITFGNPRRVTVFVDSVR